MPGTAIRTYIPNPVIEQSIWQQVGLPSRGEPLHRKVREGIEYPVFSTLANLAGLDIRQLAATLGIPATTAHRRAREGRFNPQESDRIVRMLEVLDAATRLFEGDRSNACEWLQRPARGLGNQTPLSLLGTSVETEAVLDLIGRLEHGVIA